MRRFVVGDVHGNLAALEQVLERSGYDEADDFLIFLGDIVDGQPHSMQVIDYILDLPIQENVVVCLGNHDDFMLDWVHNPYASLYHFELWYFQGGQQTLESYLDEKLTRMDLIRMWGTKPTDILPQDHIDFLKNMVPYYELDGKLFVHGGFRPGIPIERQGVPGLIWDRDLWYTTLASQKNIPEYDEVYIGHTDIGPGEPLWRANLCNMDTGAGWNGRLSIMDIDTKEVWQSDLVEELYPGHRGRNG